MTKDKWPLLWKQMQVAHDLECDGKCERFRLAKQGVYKPFNVVYLLDGSECNKQIYDIVEKELKQTNDSQLVYDISVGEYMCDDKAVEKSGLINFLTFMLDCVEKDE